ncbi:MAG: TRAP transporter large permease subunit [Burkholderiaceae bacterium]
MDRIIGRALELLLGGLVTLEVLVLGAGVIARYGLGRPLTWSDEFASMVFLWLAMLGAVLALRRNEHMRLAALSAKLRPRLRRQVEVFGMLVVALLVGALLRPAYQYAADQAAITTPSLEISDAWRVAALPLSCALMLWTALVQVGVKARAKDLMAGILVLVALVGILWFLRPYLIALGHLNLLVFFVGVVGVTVLIGVPIGYCFGIATLSYLLFATHAPLSIIVSRIDEGTSNLILLAVPLFIFLGALIEVTGLARALVGFVADLIGHVRGGLSYVLLVAMYLVSGISGSKAADMAAVAPALLPEMQKRGANRGEMVALLAASGAMSETIAPSLVLITIGSVCSVSIAQLFTAGLLPALVCALALSAVVRWRARFETAVLAARADLRSLGRSALKALPALVLPVLIRLAVVRGVATATEVSTIGIVYTIVAGLVVYRSFPLKRIPALLVDTAALSGAILLIIGMATAMAWALTQSGFSRELARLVTGVPGGATAFLLVSAVAFAILGSVLEGIPAIVLFGPLLFPVARLLGISDVHYAMTVVIAMGLGLFAPPLGVGFYAACAIAKTPADLAMRPIWPYLGALVIALVVVALVPWLSTALL